MSASLWQPPSGAGIASMTKLPPSPEIKALVHSSGPLESLSLVEEEKHQGPSSRLQSIARYQAFQPQALACSSPVSSTFSSEGTTAGDGVHNRQKNSAAAARARANTSPLVGHERNMMNTSSLGAVAGAQGVAVFRVSQPHAPLLVLSHSSNSVSRGQFITSLAFQPDNSSQSLYLAAARGSGVLVWDVGGHSLSPLLGRLGVEAATSESDLITSLAWKPTRSSASSSTPLLATTTSVSACLWDLRFSSQTPKPCLRFGHSTNTTNSRGNRSIPTATAGTVGTASSYVQVACSRSEECATLDASGTVRVFDVRMSERPRSAASSAICSFVALQYAGIGISHFPLVGDGQEQHSCWLTWGLDAPNTDSVVKTWSSAPSYWDTDGSPERGSGGGMTYKPTYRLVARCSTPGYHLACPRVCPEPVKNSIVTVSLQESDTGLDSSSVASSGIWRADLWKLKLTDTGTNDHNEIIDGTFGLEKVVSFKEEPNVSKFISSTLGKGPGLGRLCAAELAISSHSSVLPRLKNDDKDALSEGTIDDDNDAGLVLCCLSDQGYVTTRVIPEALPRKQPVLADLNAAVSPIRQAPRNAHVQAKVYPEDKDVAINDAARIWAARGGDRTGTTSRSTSEMRNSQLVLSSPPKSNDSQEIQGNPSRGSVVDGGGTMLFDMDVPAVAYGSVAPSGIAGMPIGVNELKSTKNIAASSGMGVVAEENDQAAATDIRDIAEMMENIETDRIPCPRLCGASFGPGVGGLAIFQNGDVRKLWFWYERSDSNRLNAGLPGIIAEPTSSEMETTIHASSLSANEEKSTKKIRKDCPRTLQDLNDMTAAAKESQWGERNDLDGSTANDEESAGDNFFEYFSECSQSSDSENDEQPTDGLMDIAVENKQSHGMYDNYFDNFQRLVADQFSSSVEKPDQEDQHTHRSNDRSPVSSRKHTTTVGPSSDMLAPLVRVTHDYDHLALNGQSPKLAEAFQLGRWYLEAMETNRDTFDGHMHMIPGASADPRNLKGYGDSTWRSAGSTSNRDMMPNYKFLVPSSQWSPPIHRTRSDSLLIKTPVRGASSNTGVQNFDEPGVHGGEYSIRPNMQESMVFLRKLFSHQQEGKHSFPTLLSPPDSPLLPNSLSQYPVKNAHSVGGKLTSVRDEEFNEGENEEVPSRPVGPGGPGHVFQPNVFIPRMPKDVVSVRDQELLTKIKERCLHYSVLCEDLGEDEKGGVWKLLAQMVDNRLQDALQSFNFGCGASGRGGGALGVDLVQNIFRYYESLGDVQMLATMVCILSGGKRQTSQQNHNEFSNYRNSTLFSFLPEGQDEKYDTYIHRYSDLLYGWRLLTIRAELNKHLVQSTPLGEGENVLSYSHVREDTDTLQGSRRQPGMAFVFMCQQCGKEADLNTNVCRSCQDYAFRCSVCENGVRGLFIVCDACGHGGHVRHLTTWFKKHSECPSGCGCNCTFTASPPMKPSSSGEIVPSLHSPITDPLGVATGPLPPH